MNENRAKAELVRIAAELRFVRDMLKSVRGETRTYYLQIEHALENRKRILEHFLGYGRSKRSRNESDTHRPSKR